jgi:hypothetical protein
MVVAIMIGNPQRISPGSLVWRSGSIEWNSRLGRLLIPMQIRYAIKEVRAASQIVIPRMSGIIEGNKS